MLKVSSTVSVQPVSFSNATIYLVSIQHTSCNDHHMAQHTNVSRTSLVNQECSHPTISHQSSPCSGRTPWRWRRLPACLAVARLFSEKIIAFFILSIVAKYSWRIRYPNMVCDIKFPQDQTEADKCWIKFQSWGWSVYLHIWSVY